MTGNAPFVRVRHALIAADSGSWTYSFSSALGSAYVRSALATVRVAQRFRCRSADGPRLIAAQPFQVVLGRRRRSSAARPVSGETVLGSTLVRHDASASSSTSFLTLGKLLRQVTDAGSRRHRVRQVCLTRIEASTIREGRLQADARQQRQIVRIEADLHRAFLSGVQTRLTSGSARG